MPLAPFELLLRWKIIIANSHDTPELFSFKWEEKVLVEILCGAVRSVLARPGLKTADIHCCAVMLRALERLPLVTPNVMLRLSLVSRCDTGWGSLNLAIEEEFLELQTGETFYEPQGTEYSSVVHLKVGCGWRKADEELYELEAWAESFANRAEDPGIVVEFEDEQSEIDWNDDTVGAAYWEQLDSDDA